MVQSGGWVEKIPAVAYLFTASRWLLPAAALHQSGGCESRLPLWSKEWRAGSHGHHYPLSALVRRSNVAAVTFTYTSHTCHNRQRHLDGYDYGYILGPSPVPPTYLSGSFGLVRPAWI